MGASPWWSKFEVPSRSGLSALTPTTNHPLPLPLRNSMFRSQTENVVLESGSLKTSPLYFENRRASSTQQFFFLASSSQPSTFDPCPKNTLNCWFFQSPHVHIKPLKLHIKIDIIVTSSSSSSAARGLCGGFVGCRCRQSAVFDRRNRCRSPLRVRSTCMLARNRRHWHVPATCRRHSWLSLGHQPLFFDSHDYRRYYYVLFV